MSSDPVYRRVGRGGAGNWYSKKDIDEAERTQATADLEAQKSAASVAPSAEAHSAPAFARSGRGGVGNFKDQAAAAESIKLEREEAERAKAVVAASIGKAKHPFSGRGGAGNWSDGTTPLGAAQQELEQRKVEDLELKVLKDVEAGLAMPAPTYQHPERET